MKKFSLRDMLMVALIIGLAVGWSVDRRQQRMWLEGQIESADRQAQAIDSRLRIAQETDSGKVLVQLVIFQGGNGGTTTIIRPSLDEGE
jgi:hypothetical protein